jgi:hypothetical protein
MDTPPPISIFGVLPTLRNGSRLIENAASVTVGIFFGLLKNRIPACPDPPGERGRVAEFLPPKDREKKDLPRDQKVSV